MILHVTFITGQTLPLIFFFYLPRNTIYICMPLFKKNNPKKKVFNFRVNFDSVQSARSIIWQEDSYSRLRRRVCIIAPEQYLASFRSRLGERKSTGLSPALTCLVLEAPYRADATMTFTTYAWIQTCLSLQNNRFHICSLQVQIR